MRLIEAIIPKACAELARKAVEETKPAHWRMQEASHDEIVIFRVFFADDDPQGLFDTLQAICEGRENWRIIALPVEATAPKPEEKNDPEDEKVRKQKKSLREEIYNDVEKGARLSSDFFVLTVASTVVAALGLNADNVAAVIGAMVIAPLLGPILAMSFASALGDFKLLLRAGGNAIAGLALGFATAVGIGLVVTLNYESNELMSRTVAGVDSIFLGLAAGVAAALSIVTGISAALVGVMVAVALLPPAAAAGLFLGAGETGLFARAILLLSVNIVCILLSSQIVYFYKNIRPRTFLEKKKAGKAQKISFAILVALLAALAFIIIFAPTGTLADLPVREA